MKRAHLLLLLPLLLLLTGCPAEDDEYLLSEENYLVGFIIHDYNENSPRHLEYDAEDLATHRFHYDFPAWNPVDFGGATFWTTPHLEGRGASSAASVLSNPTPITKTFYLYGDQPNPDFYGDNDWEFSNHYGMNYLTAANEDQQFYLDVRQDERHYGDRWNDKFSPVEGEEKDYYFGRAPFLPTSIEVERSYLSLSHELMRGYGGNTYLRKGMIEHAIVSDGSEIYTQEQAPTYRVYKGEDLVLEDDLINSYYKRWAYWELSERLEDNAAYRVEVSIPLHYPTWSLVEIEAEFDTSNTDHDPPNVEHIEIPARFGADPIAISARFSDSSDFINLQYFIRENRNGEWVSVLDQYTPSESATTLDLQIIATDDSDNSVIYTIYDASRRERDLELNTVSSTHDVTRGEHISISGRCEDDRGYCANMHILATLDGEKIASTYSKTEWERIGRLEGEFSFRVQIPFDYVGESPDLKLHAGDTGIYLPYEEKIDVDFVLFQNDLAMDTLSIDQTAEILTIDSTVHNVGENDFGTYNVELIVQDLENRETIHTESQSFESLATLQSQEVSFSWSPQEYNNYIITLSTTTADDNNFNDQSEEFVQHGFDLFVNIAQFDEPFILGKQKSVPFLVENLGPLRSDPITVYLFNDVDRGYIDLPMGERTLETIKGKEYLFEPTIENDVATLHIEDSNGRSSYVIEEDQIIIRQDISFIVDHISERWVDLSALPTTPITKQINPLHDGQYIVDSIDIIPQRSGWQQLIVFADAGVDLNYKNNVEYSSIRVNHQFADLEVYHIQNPTVQAPGEEAVYEVYVDNIGDTTVQNAVLHNYHFTDLITENGNYFINTPATFATQEYQISAKPLADYLLDVTITTSSATYEFQSTIGVPTQLTEGIYFVVDSMRETYYRFHIGNAVHSEAAIPNLASSSEAVIHVTLELSSSDYQRLISHASSEDDAESSNNFESGTIRPKQPGIDLNTWTWFMDPPYTINEITNIDLEVDNQGTQTSQAQSVAHHIIHPAQKIYFGNQPTTFTFAEQAYTLSVVSETKEEITLSIEAEQAHEITLSKIGEDYEVIEENIYIAWSQDSPYDSSLLIGRLQSSDVIEISAIDPSSFDSEILQWTPTELGKYVHIFETSDEEDVNPLNNIEVDEIIVTSHGPDIRFGIWAANFVAVGSSLSLETYSYNDGTRDSEAFETIIHHFYPYTSSPIAKEAQLTFEDTLYTITIESADEQFNVVIESNGQTQSATLFEEQVHHLGEDIYLFLSSEQVYNERDVLEDIRITAYLGRAEVSSIAVPTLSMFDSFSKFEDRIYEQPGKYIAVAQAALASDILMKNNFDAEFFEVYSTEEINVKITDGANDVARDLRIADQTYTITEPTLIELPILAGSPLSLSHLDLTQGISASQEFYQTTIADPLEITSAYYPQIGHKYHVFANTLNLESEQSDAGIMVFSDLFSELGSSLVVFTCADWDFTTTTCASGWSPAQNGEVRAAVEFFDSNRPIEAALLDSNDQVIDISTIFFAYEEEFEAISIGQPDSDGDGVPDPLEVSGSTPTPSASPSSSGRSGGGGGGSGSSGRLSAGASKFWNRAVETLEMSITSSSIALSRIQADLKSILKSAEIRILSLSTNPISDILRGKHVYQYIEIKEKNIPADSVSKVNMEFEVPKSWTDSKGVSPDSIELYRAVDNRWVKVPTKLTKRGDTFKYTAISPGMSYFAVAGSKESPSPSSAKKATSTATTNTPTQRDPTPTQREPEPQPKEPLNEDNSILFSLIPLILVLIIAPIGIVLFYVHRRHLDTKVEAEEEYLLHYYTPDVVMRRMLSEGYSQAEITKEYKLIQLKHYIVRARSLGNTDMVIKSALRQAGWNTALVKKAYKELKEHR